MNSFVVDMNTVKYKVFQCFCVCGLLLMWFISYKLFTAEDGGYGFKGNLMFWALMTFIYVGASVAMYMEVKSFKICVENENIEIIRRGIETIRINVNAIEGFETFSAVETGGKAGAVKMVGMILHVRGERITLYRAYIRNFNTFQKYLENKGKFLRHIEYRNGVEVNRGM